VPDRKVLFLRTIKYHCSERDIKRDNKVEANSIDNSKNLKRGQKMNILTNFYRGSKIQAKNTCKQY
jgi:excinuclease UvrABC ATPase subunit